MLNSEFNELKNWMFGSLNELLKDIKHNPKYDIIKMSIGEPKMDPPQFILNILNNSLSDATELPEKNINRTNMKNFFNIIFILLKLVLKYSQVQGLFFL